MKHFIRRKKILILLFGISLFVFFYSNLSKTLQFSELLNDSVNTNDDTVINIFLWGTKYGPNNWFMQKAASKNIRYDKKYFESINCPVTCIVTNNKSSLSALELFDAIVFHFAPAHLTVNLTSHVRTSQQLYVGLSYESPVNSQTALLKGNLGNLYNLTMTYRMDSDIFSPYSEIEEIETGTKVAPSISPVWRLPDDHFTDENYIERTRNKTKLVAWFVSNCNAQSKRGNLAKDLQKHLQVDIYGNCGKLKCPRSTEHACFDMLEENYKFYLAFENSLCEDYVTEKLFTSMTRLVIPVVLGGANYTRFAPPHSYINVNDFNDTLSLAEYLIYLDKNPDEYVKYFWWKKHYQVIKPKPYCDLCQAIHEIKTGKKIIPHRNIHKWWFSGKCDEKSKINFNL